MLELLAEHGHGRVARRGDHAPCRRSISGTIVNWGKRWSEAYAPEGPLWRSMKSRIDVHEEQPAQYINVDTTCIDGSAAADIWMQPYPALTAPFPSHGSTSCSRRSCGMISSCAIGRTLPSSFARTRASFCAPMSSRAVSARTSWSPRSPRAT